MKYARINTDRKGKKLNLQMLGFWGCTPGQGASGGSTAPKLAGSGADRDRGVLVPAPCLGQHLLIPTLLSPWSTHHLWQRFQNKNKKEKQRKRTRWTSWDFFFLPPLLLAFLLLKRDGKPETEVTHLYLQRNIWGIQYANNLAYSYIVSR